MRLTSERGGLDVTSVRLIGTEASRPYWVARDAAGEICLIVALNDTLQTVASVCSPPDRVARSGVVLAFSAAGVDEAIAYLLPDDAEIDKARAPWKTVGDNVLVAPTAGLRASQVPLTSGGSIALRPPPSPPDGVVRG